MVYINLNKTGPYKTTTTTLAPPRLHDSLYILRSENMAPPKNTPKEPSKPPAPPSPSPSPPLSDHDDNDEEEEYTASSDPPSPHPNPLPKTSANSNVDEEDGDDDGDDGDDGGEGDSTDDGETPTKFTIKPSVPTPAADDDISGDDTDPESPPPPPSKPKLVKPLNTKPMDSKAKADWKKAAATTPAKRPAEASGAAGSDDEVQHPAKKQIIQRLWSDEDEITILKGMAEYKKKGRDPLADFQGFFRYIRKSLQLECTQTQLSSKVRVFRSKFHTRVKRANEGKQPTSNRPKDKLVFELSQKIWGSKLEEKEKNNMDEEAGIKEEEAKVKSGSEMSNGKAKRKKANKSGQRTSEVAVALPAVETAAPAAAPVLGGGEERSWLLEDLCIRGVGVSEELVKKGVSLMDRRVVSEYEEKWKAMKMMEMEVQMKRAELVKGHIGAILEALKSGKR